MDTIGRPAMSDRIIFDKFGGILLQTATVNQPVLQATFVKLRGKVRCGSFRMRSKNIWRGCRTASL
jgi:hypothetical protein